MMTVNRVSKLTGVSIRTLQYYDRIGLLPATAHTEAGYRLYDEAALERLQQILLFRRLQFPLKDIAAILNSPGFDREKALEQQIRLLEMQQEQLGRLIRLARDLQNKEGNTMDFSPFDTAKLDAYARQAKESWGTTPAWQEYEVKSQGRDTREERELGRGLMDIFAQLGAVKDGPAHATDAQALIQKLQDHITEHYYTCTSQILLSLGQMYAAGGEFTENIDAAGGTGTAEFACRAIRVYCAEL